MSLRHPAAVLLSTAVLAAGSRAAADPTKQECVSANEAAQDQQAAGKLLNARRELAMCIAASCPAAIRQDCAQRLDDVTRATPSLIFAAKKPSGDDLTAVRVTMDGALLVDHLDGKAVDVDPGPHRFAFETEGFSPHGRDLVVRMGEKDRIVEVDLLPAHAAPVLVPPPISVTHVREHPRRTLLAPTVASFVVGVAGAVAGGVLTALWAQAKTDGDAACGVPFSCAPATASQWEGQQVGYSVGLGVAFGVAVVGLALGIGLLVAGSPKDSPQTHVVLGPKGLGILF